MIPVRALCRDRMHRNRGVCAHRSVLFIGPPGVGPRRRGLNGSCQNPAPTYGGADAHSPVRDLSGRRDVPRGRYRDCRNCWSGSATRSSSPPARPAAARCTSTPAISAQATALVRHHVEVFERSGCDAVVAPSGSCVGSVRHQHAMVARRAGDDRRWPQRAEARRGAHLRAVRTVGRRARRDRCRRVLPAPGHLSPDLPLAAAAARRRQAAATAAPGARADVGGAAERRDLLRLRRHVRDQERRHLDRDAGRQDVGGHRTRAPRCAPPATVRA